MGRQYKVQKENLGKAQPKELRKLGTSELKIVWSDGHESLYGFRYLRLSCQCAMCLDEWSGQPVLFREQVPQDLYGLKVTLVGQYALNIDFSDGHRTGIYAFTHLRKICPCQSCSNEAK